MKLVYKIHHDLKTQMTYVIDDKSKHRIEVLFNDPNLANLYDLSLLGEISYYECYEDAFYKLCLRLPYVILVQLFFLVDRYFKQVIYYVLSDNISISRDDFILVNDIDNLSKITSILRAIRKENINYLKLNKELNYNEYIGALKQTYNRTIKNVNFANILLREEDLDDICTR